MEPIDNITGLLDTLGVDAPEALSRLYPIRDEIRAAVHDDGDDLGKVTALIAAPGATARKVTAALADLGASTAARDAAAKYAADLNRAIDLAANRALIAAAPDLHDQLADRFTEHLEVFRTGYRAMGGTTSPSPEVMRVPAAAQAHQATIAALNWMRALRRYRWTVAAAYPVTPEPLWWLVDADDMDNQHLSVDKLAQTDAELRFNTAEQINQIRSEQATRKQAAADRAAAHKRQRDDADPMVRAWRAEAERAEAMHTPAHPGLHG